MVRKISLYKLALKRFTGTNINVAARIKKKGKKGKIKSRQERKISRNKMKKRIAESEIRMRDAQEKLKITIKNLKKQNS